MATWQGRKGGYHQEDGKHASARKEEKWQQALLISPALKATLRISNCVVAKQRGSANSDGTNWGTRRLKAKLGQPNHNTIYCLRS